MGLQYNLRYNAPFLLPGQAAQPMDRSAFSALRHRDFRLFWVGQGISLTGTHMARVAVAWHVYALSNSPVALGLLGACKFLPVVLFAIPGGTLADRFNRRLLLILATLVLAATSAWLWWSTVAGHITVEAIYAAVALQAAATAVGGPARQSLVPNLIPPADLQPAVTLSLLTWDVAGVAGPALGGVVLAQAGAAAVYLFDAVTYGAVLFSLLRMQDHPTVRGDAPPQPPLAAMWTGVRWVTRQPLILSTMLLDFFATVFGQATVLFPILARDVLHVDERGLGLLYAAPALGSVLTGLALAVGPQLRRHGAWLLSSVAIYGAATVAYGASAFLPLTLLMLAVSGGADTVSTVLRQTLRQRLTPDDMRGRMTGVNMIFFNGGPQLGELESGVAAALLGVGPAIMVGGLGVLVVTGVALLMVPGLRRYVDVPPPG